MTSNYICWKCGGRWLPRFYRFGREVEPKHPCPWCQLAAANETIKCYDGMKEGVSIRIADIEQQLAAVTAERDQLAKVCEAYDNVMAAYRMGGERRREDSLDVIRDYRKAKEAKT